MLHSLKTLLKLLKWCKSVFFRHTQPRSHARCYFTHSLKCTKFDFDLTIPPAGFNCFWWINTLIKQKSAWLRLWSLVSIYDKTGEKMSFLPKNQQDGKPRWQSWRVKVLLTLLDPRLSCLLKLRKVIKKLHGQMSLQIQLIAGVTVLMVQAIQWVFVLSLLHFFTNFHENKLR